MCLAIPGKITDLYEQNGLKMAKIDFGGVTQVVCMETLPEAEVGQYAIVHAGFALNLMSPDEAAETMDLLREAGILEEEFQSE
ncbi:MAG TPA: HypC/HybG/HupF family hydrogenase formation chaperone [Bellilinea sp.]|jgi:hydrogenase expression/formation protein HypC|nr:HypC/HybG/HupF family hydrogenase formation chaperone [Bellilinea sp.]